MALNVQQEMRKNLTGKPAAKTFRKAGRKAPGTRIGIFIDWREGSTESGKVSGPYGHALRDGR
jgi:hypothetical protein